MAIDSSIYFRQKTPDIAGAIQEGKTMADMARKRKVEEQDQEYKDALKKAYVADASGKISINPKSMADLARLDPEKTYAIQQQMANNERNTRQQKLQDFKTKLDIGNQLLGGITDAQSYSAIRPQLIKNGIFDENELPEQYDPNLIKTHQMQALSLKDRLDQEFKKRDAERKDQELGIRKSELEAKRNDLAVRRGEQDSRHQTTMMDQTMKMLESGRGNPAIQQAQKDLYSASKLKSLINLNGDPNNLNPQMVKLVAAEVAKMAQGGVPQMEELKSLTPSSLSGAFADAAQKFTNNPTPANQGAFLKQYQKYGKLLANDAREVIKQKYGRVLESRRKIIGEDNYNTLKQNYVDPLLEEDKGFGSQHHPHDSAAVQWAKQNPSDPRAAKILQINGIGNEVQ